MLTIARNLEAIAGSLDSILQVLLGLVVVIMLLSISALVSYRSLSRRIDSIAVKLETVYQWTLIKDLKRSGVVEFRGGIPSKVDREGFREEFNSLAKGAETQQVVDQQTSPAMADQEQPKLEIVEPDGDRFGVNFDPPPGSRPPAPPAPPKRPMRDGVY